MTGHRTYKNAIIFKTRISDVLWCIRGFNHGSRKIKISQSWIKKMPNSFNNLYTVYCLMGLQVESLHRIDKANFNDKLHSCQM
jgi:hypothetical protein